MNLNIVISGVGGQGSVLAARALALSAMENGLSVLTSEVIGMAQREGMVTSHVRMGNEIYSPTIPDHGADLLLGLELAETVRSLPKLKPEGSVIASTSTITPVPVQLGLSKYNSEALIDYLKKRTEKVFLLDLDVLSQRAGHPKTGNVVILGALSTLPGLPFSQNQLLKSVLKQVPNKLKDVNTRAFEIGRRAMEVA